jgi:ribosome-associated protein
MMVEDGEATLNGQPESRKRAKLRPGDEVRIFGKTIKIEL